MAPYVGSFLPPCGKGAPCCPQSEPVLELMEKIPLTAFEVQEKVNPRAKGWVADLEERQRCPFCACSLPSLSFAFALSPIAINTLKSCAPNALSCTPLECHLRHCIYHRRTGWAGLRLTPPPPPRPNSNCQLRSNRIFPTAFGTVTVSSLP